MVMETPSPQCVGREFVRQYYTLLHEAPSYLHRFYSHNSSFVHGGVEKPGEEHPPVMGQANIHKKILSLNFNDCHAKIRQVDSQATVGSAVVVQVTGELSNNGQPMRRFMQTFVLAPQMPKKYYVHNDIFRYQDEVFHDSDTEADGTEETNTDGHVDMVEEVPGPQPSAEHHVQDPTVTSYYEAPAASAQPPQPAQVPLSNGTAHLPEEEAPDMTVSEEPEPPAPAEEEEPEVEGAADGEADQLEFGKDVEEKPAEPEAAEEQSTSEAPKPFSWAALASKGSASAPAPPPPVAVAPVPKPVAPKSSPEAPSASSGPQPQRAQRPSRAERPRENSRPSGGPSTSIEEDPRRPRYPDTHQLFVGNLPHSILEKELKQFFEEYGPVVEVRIKGKGTRDVPNFSFVVFDSADSVQKVLSARPLMIRGEHRLNVEEKKQRGEQGVRPGSGTRTGSRGGGPPGMGRGGGNGPPGGMSRGGSRGGMSDRPRGGMGGNGPQGNRGGFAPRR